MVVVDGMGRWVGELDEKVHGGQSIFLPVLACMMAGGCRAWMGP